MIAAEEWKAGGWDTGIRQSQSIIVAADFGGEHKSARFNSLTFLCVGLDALGPWLAKREQAREIAGRGRRISFKNLQERERARLAVPFLGAADQLCGLLLTILIDKRLGSIFRTEDGSAPQGAFEAVERFDSDTRERLLRISHLVGLLLSCITRPGQDVLVLCDEDSVFANPYRHKLATDVMVHISSHYLSHTLGHMRVATTKSDTGNLSVEDLVAIPDLVTGALADAYDRAGLHGGVLSPLPPGKRKTQLVLGWWARRDSQLKRSGFILSETADERIMTRRLLVEAE